MVPPVDLAHDLLVRRLPAAFLKESLDLAFGAVFELRLGGVPGLEGFVGRFGGAAVVVRLGDWSH